MQLMGLDSYKQISDYFDIPSCADSFHSREVGFIAALILGGAQAMVVARIGANSGGRFAVQQPLPCVQVLQRV